MEIRRNTEEVLVVVKASPQPSRQYGDTVCVAGISMDKPHRWLRLYPVPFRYLQGDKQFSKYDVIRVKLRDNPRDKRSESRQIDADSLEIIGQASSWRQRALFVEPLVTDTMCGLLRRVSEDLNAQSLGAVRPASVTGLEFARSKPWNRDQELSLRRYAEQPRLLDDAPCPGC